MKNSPLTRTEKVIIALFAAALVAGGAISLQRRYVAPVRMKTLFAATQGYSYRIDLNSATVEELMLLRGIGRVRARRIVEYRQLNGPFRSLEELLNIQGISERIVSDIADVVKIRPPLEISDGASASKKQSIPQEN